MSGDRASAKALSWVCPWVQGNGREASVAQAEWVRRGVKYAIREVARSLRNSQPCLDFIVNETESHWAESEPGGNGSGFRFERITLALAWRMGCTRTRVGVEETVWRPGNSSGKRRWWLGCW